MPFGPYVDFADCVAKNSKQANPAAFCAWLHNQITGTWPGEMAADGSLPEEAFKLYIGKYTEALDAGTGEKEAHSGGLAALEEAGWIQAQRGWTKYIGSNLQAPKMCNVGSVPVFATGTHTDSAGFTKTWTRDDLEKMVAAFNAGVPAIVPLKCGHTPDKFNSVIAEKLGVPVEVVTGDHGHGQIALGKMASMEVNGNELIAGFERVPEVIGNLIESGMFTAVSVEIDDQVGDYGPVITAVALLGAEEPAVDKATLEEASVFGKPREGAQVFTFAVPDGTLQDEFTDLRNRLTEWIKGKRGAPIFRAFIAKLNEMFEQMAGGRHQKTEPPEDVLKLAKAEYAGNVTALVNWAGTVGFDACVLSLSGKPGVNDPAKVCGWLIGQHESQKEGFQNMDKIAVLLGLPETATEEEIMAKINELVALQKPPEGPPPEAPVVPEGFSEEFSSMKNTIKEQAALIANLTHKDRVAGYLKFTREFKAVAGKPEDLAESLASLEETAGKEAADRVLTTYQAADKTGQAALTAVGTAMKGQAALDFEEKVQAFSKEHPDMSRADVIKSVMRSDPDAYREQAQVTE